MSKVINKSNSILLEKLTWQQVRDEVMAKNIELAQAIDSVNPSKDYLLFKLTCPYGTQIVKHNKLHLPNTAGEMVPLDDLSIEPHIRSNLNYNLGSNPVTLVLKNTVELFLDLEDRIIPFYGLIGPGGIFGLWRVLSQHAHYKVDEIWDSFQWGMTAGARSVFMLPKITEVERHKRLKKIYQINANVPKNLTDHWHIFKELSQHQSFTEKWETEILLFGHKWFTHFDDPAWMEFNYYLYRKAWLGSESWRNDSFWNLKLSSFHKKHAIKISPVIMDTAKYLLGMGVGKCVGFVPALDNDALPLNSIQEIYVNDYNLKEYAPIIMQPCHLSKATACLDRPVYYSLLHPITMSYKQNLYDKVSYITDLYELKSLLSKYLLELTLDKADIMCSPLYKLNNEVRFDYYHTYGQGQSDIKNSGEIVKDDLSFLQTKYPQNKEFPENASFIKCCIKVSKRIDEKGG